MKKTILAIGSVALSGCLLFAFAGCGAVNKAKSMKGEQVTEDVWNIAMADTVYGTNSVAKNPVQTVADETAELPNFKAEYESKAKVDVSTEGGNIGDQQIEASNLNIDMTSSSTVIVADNALHITLKYDFKFDGSQNLLDLLEIPEGMNGSGEVELYISYADGISFYVKDSNGNWISASVDSTGLGEAAQGAVETCMTLIDQSGLVGQFSKFAYSSEHKGYVAVDAGVSGGSDGGMFGASAELVYKMKDNRLAAIYSAANVDTNIFGVSMGGNTEIGLVYTYGGQSVTLPSVA